MLWHRKKLTAEEVKELPDGATVFVHGRDRHGYSTERMCEIITDGRARKLRYFDSSEMMVKRMPVRKLDGVVHFYTVEDRGEERA